MRDGMVDDRQLAIQRVTFPSGRTQERTVALQPADVSHFTASEIALVDQIIEALEDHSADEVSKLSHKMVGWKVMDSREGIPYTTVFVSDEELSETEIARGQEVAQRLSLMEA